MIIHWSCLFFLLTLVCVPVKCQGAPPRITPFEFRIGLKPGDRIGVPCVPSQGSPPFTFEWLKNGSRLESTDRVQIRIDRTDSVLKFESLRSEDSAKYTCRVSNAVGADEFHATLSIKVPAKIVEPKFTLKNVKKGEEVKLLCVAQGEYPLKVYWTRGTEKIAQTLQYDILEKKVDEGISVELTMHNTRIDDSATYTCIAENAYGKDEKSCKIVVLETPAAPYAFSLTEVWSRSASISWAAPPGLAAPITGYVIQYWKESRSGENGRLDEEHVPASQTSFLLKNLHPGSVYEAHVQALNEVGRGRATPKLWFKTGEEEPSAPPTNVVLVPRSSKSVSVSWTAPPRHLWNGNITGYYIHYRTTELNQPYVKTVPAENDENATRKYTFLVTGLTVSTLYHISVKAYSRAGTGPSSQELTVRTLAGDPPHPPELHTFNVLSQSSVKLHWRYFHMDYTEVSFFTVYCMRLDIPETTVISPVNRFTSNFVVQNLEPGAKYSFHVTASNAYGESEESGEVVVHLHDSAVKFLLLLAESNIILFGAVVVGLVTVSVAILLSCAYVKRAEVRQEVEVRRYQTLARAHFGEKCGTMRTLSDPSYATIPADCGHIPMRQAESNASSYGYGAPIDSDPIAISHKFHVPTTTKKSKDYEELIYDDTNG